MSINWFPGHMTKAYRQLQEALKRVDIVIELRDARVVAASENPLFKQLLQGKPRIIVLSKRDLADQSVTEQWIKHLQAQGETVVALDFFNDDLRVIFDKCQLLMQEKHQRQIKRGIKPRATRALIAGIPNVGKSTLINRLLKRKSLVVADQPGVTRALKLVKVNEQLELLDSPGILMPKIEDQQTALLLAVSGAISDKAYQLQEVAQFAYDYLFVNYPDILFSRYGQLSSKFQEAMELIGQSRKFLVKEGKSDLERTLITFLDEVRSPYFKGVSWQKV